MESRPRREKKARVNHAALEMLETAKSGNLKRSEQFKVKDQESIFVEMDEEEYANLVSKRREDDFLEEDGDDLGYKDDGEEVWNREDSDDDYEEKDAYASKIGMVTTKVNEEQKQKRPDHSLSALLQKQALKAKAKAASNTSTVSVKTEGTDPASSGTKRKLDSKADIGLDNLLADLTAEVKPKKPAGSKPLNTGRASAIALKGSAFNMPRKPVQTMISPMDSKKKPAVPQRKKVQTHAVQIKQEEFEPNDEFQNDDPQQFDEHPLDEVKMEDPVEEKFVVSNSEGGFARDGNANRKKMLAEVEDWRAMRDAVTDADMEVDESKIIPKVEDLNSGDVKFEVNDDGTLKFFWIDAYEDASKAGTVFLFGKIKIQNNDSDKPSFMSCCIHVENLQRQVFVLPREKLLDKDGNPMDEDVDLMNHVFPEFAKFARDAGIKKHKAKLVKRNYMYHFQDPSIPKTAQYLKFVYPAEFPAIASDLAGRSFKKVFGTTQSCLELLLLKRKLMGPCWLNIQGAEPVSTQISWCKHEFRVADSKWIQKSTVYMETPPLRVMSVHMQTVKNPRDHSNEVAMLSALCHNEVNADGPTDRPENKMFGFTGIRKLEGAAWPLDFKNKIDQFNASHKDAPRYIHENERALLNAFLAKLQLMDPDVIIGHNFIGFDLDVLLHRMQKLKIPGWSKLGRLRRTNMPKLQNNAGGMGQSTWAEKNVLSGRLVCDTYIAAKENLRETTYTLSELAKTQLQKVRFDIDFQQVASYFGKSTDLLQLIACNENDSYLCLLLTFKLMILPLTKQLTNLAGNLWSRSLLSARAERVEYLLLHEFQKLKFVMPDKASFKNKKINKDELNFDEEGEEDSNPKWSKRKKAAYSGGLVLDPKRGLYDKHILLLDFNSLYPTIIQEFNICFTTVLPASHSEDEAPRYEMPSKDLDEGVLPRVIKTLVERRRSVKEIIKKESDATKRQQLDIRQSALKIMANSMYGCLGFTYSRFYAKPLAELITAQGRELLQRTVDVTQNKLNLEVVYGDTDSIFVNSGCDTYEEAVKTANEARKELNKMWRLLEVGLDGIYCPLLLLNKKKYAALSVTERDGKITKVKEKKGLDIVRRDWCVLAKRAGDKILDFILSGNPVEDVVDNIHTYLRQLASDMESNSLPLSDYVITKGLTKEPEEYSDGKTQPHVQVALKMKERGRPVRAGDHIPYVICADPSITMFAQRAHDPEVVEEAAGKLVLDKKWYLESQLHPVVSRICAVIEGTDSGRIAECLGLDATKFHKNEARSQSNFDSVFAQPAVEVDRFASVERLMGTCSDGLTREFKGPYVLQDGAAGANSLICGMRCADAAGSSFNPRALRLQVDNLLRRCLSRYHDGWMCCSDNMCGHRTRNVMCDVYHEGNTAYFGLKCPMPECGGRMRLEYTSEQLYLQILYLKRLFDLKDAERRLQLENSERKERGFVSLKAPVFANEERVAMEVMHEDCHRLLQESAFNMINLGSLFACEAEEEASM